MGVVRRAPKVGTARSAQAATLLAAVLLVVACGGDAGEEQDATGQEETAPEAAPDEDGDVAAEASADDADDGQGEAAQEGDGPPPVERAIESSLTGQDGWNDPLDLDIPDPGTAVLEFAGERFTFDVACFGTGEIPDTIMDGNRPLNQFLLFNFAIRGSGQTEDGRNVRIDASRGIFVAGDRALQIRNSEWGGEGQLDRIVFSGLGQASSLIQSPSTPDPDGDRLPVVRVTPEGVVTAEGELSREFADDTDAPEGPFTFAGQCQDTWPQDELEAAGAG